MKPFWLCRFQRNLWQLSQWAQHTCRPPYQLGRTPNRPVHGDLKFTRNYSLSRNFRVGKLWIRKSKKHKYRGMFETQKSGYKTSSGDIGLNIRTLASPKVGQDQVWGGISVLCWHVRFRIRCKFSMETSRNTEDSNYRLSVRICI